MVRHVIITGLILVTLILLLMIGDLRTTLIAAATGLHLLMGR
jgi:cobalt-zinc-cadmium resistance protein CzcA